MAHNEIFFLTVTTMLTGLMWFPYIVNRIFEEGLIPAVTQSQVEVNARSLWGQRAYRAHMNAIENLVIFAPLLKRIRLFPKSVSCGVNRFGMGYALPL